MLRDLSHEEKNIYMHCYTHTHRYLYKTQLCVTILRGAQTICSMCNSNVFYIVLRYQRMWYESIVLNVCNNCATYHRWSIDVPGSSRCFISHILLYKLIFVDNVTRQAIKHISPPSPHANYMSLLNTIYDIKLSQWHRMASRYQKRKRL